MADINVDRQLDSVGFGAFYGSQTSCLDLVVIDRTAISKAVHTIYQCTLLFIPGMINAFQSTLREVITGDLLLASRHVEFTSFQS
jgi:hypothetical protein